MHLHAQTLLAVVLMLALPAGWVFNGIAQAGSDAQAEFVELNASKDNSLFNDDKGTISNGLGNLFAGRTASRGPGPLRALIAFDVAAEIPLGSTITDVQLTLTVLQAGTNSDNESYSLHRVEQDWGEGSSIAFTGRGAASTPGDATWSHTFFNSRLWTNPGGDFESSPSAIQTVGDSGPTTWQSTPQLVADVQSWLDDPSANFGWLLMGDESRSGAARMFASREAPSNVPRLTISFRRVPEPSSLMLLSSLSAVSIALRRPR